MANGTIDNLYELVRRLESDGNGFTDEGPREDFSRAFSAAIVEWKVWYSRQELVEVEYFRGQRGPSGQPLDP